MKDPDGYVVGLSRPGGKNIERKRKKHQQIEDFEKVEIPG
jgi:hypothetical protein